MTLDWRLTKSTSINASYARIKQHCLAAAVTTVLSIFTVIVELLDEIPVKSAFECKFWRENQTQNLPGIDDVITVASIALNSAILIEKLFCLS